MQSLQRFILAAPPTHQLGLLPACRNVAIPGTLLQDRRLQRFSLVDEVLGLMKNRWNKQGKKTNLIGVLYKVKDRKYIKQAWIKKTEPLLAKVRFHWDQRLQSWQPEMLGA